MLYFQKSIISLSLYREHTILHFWDRREAPICQYIKCQAKQVEMSGSKVLIPSSLHVRKIFDDICRVVAAVLHWVFVFVLCYVSCASPNSRAGDLCRKYIDYHGCNAFLWSLNFFLDRSLVAIYYPLFRFEIYSGYIVVWHHCLIIMCPIVETIGSFWSRICDSY